MSVYGEWIKPCGERILCPNVCSHTHHITYENADDEGWIAVVYGDDSLGIRLNPTNTTTKAFKGVLRIIKEQPMHTEVFIEDIFSSTIPNVPFGMKRQEAIQLIQTWRSLNDRP